MSSATPPILETKYSPSMSSVEAEVVRLIDDAPVRETPFPHISVEGIFLPEFYAEMLRQIPVREFYKRITEIVRATGDAYEQRLILHLARLDSLPIAQRNILERIGVVSRQLQSCLSAG